MIENQEQNKYKIQLVINYEIFFYYFILFLKIYHILVNFLLYFFVYILNKCND
jgi:hypothetical protein